MIQRLLRLHGKVVAELSAGPVLLEAGILDRHQAILVRHIAVIPVHRVVTVPAHLIRDHAEAIALVFRFILRLDMLGLRLTTYTYCVVHDLWSPVFDIASI